MKSPRHVSTLYDKLGVKNHRWWWIGGTIVVIVIAAQMIYPWSSVTPFTKLDSKSVGNETFASATKQLDSGYKKLELPVYFGDNTREQFHVSLADIGMSVHNSSRVHDMSYSWYWRLVPTSALWLHFIQNDTGPKMVTSSDVLKKFIAKKLGKDCHVTPINASLKADGDKLKLVKSADGGDCTSSDVYKKLSSVTPRLNIDNRVSIPVKAKKPAVSDRAATKLAKTIEAHVGEGTSIAVAKKSVDIPASTLYSWLDFAPDDHNLTASVSVKRAQSFFDKKLNPIVYEKVGTSHVTLRDFTTISSKPGETGRAIDDKMTAKQLTDFVRGGDTPKAVVMTTTPNVVYERHYTSTSTGIRALITYFVQTHPGTYGVSFRELGGQGRAADYEAENVFVTASTYKLFVAYSTIRRVDNGTWSWSDKDISDGRDRGKCFDDMIVLSDNACAVALLHGVGYQDVTDEAHAIGSTHTSFVDGNTPHSTAGDEAHFLTRLATNTLPISSSGRSKMLGDMKRQVYRQGIPSGTDAAVADKVGFLWGLLHDAAIVYSPKGTYVLVVMTDHSSWANIAALTRQIESLR